MRSLFHRYYEHNKRDNEAATAYHLIYDQEIKTINNGETRGFGETLAILLSRSNVKQVIGIGMGAGMNLFEAKAYSRLFSTKSNT